MLKRKIVVIALVGLVFGGAAVAWAENAPAGPTAGATAATPADRQAKREALRACVEKAGKDSAARRACLAAAGVRRVPRPLLALGKAVHGTLVVPGEGGAWQTVTFDRGTVGEATDGTTIVLDRRDGQKVTLALSADTRYRGIAGASAIQKGKPATVVSKGGKATLVVQRDPAHARRPRGGNNDDAAVVPSD